MSDFLASRLGQANASGDVDALFLKQWAGEVIASFNNKTVVMDKHQVRTIQNGKSAQFPAIGKATARYHTPGTEISGQSIKANERVITIDDLLIADAFLANIDEAKNHYDVRAEYNIQLSDALSQAFDQNVLQVMVAAARASATISGQSGGTTSNDADYKTVGADLAAGFFVAAQSLDEKNVPEGDRWGYVKPAQYYLLAQTTNLINRDWDGRGSFADGKIVMIAGIPVIKTNNLPVTDITTGPSAYQVDCDTTAAVISHRGAVGTVKLLDLGMESEYTVRHQGTLLVAKYAVGHGILRPHASVELRTADPS
jgi:hypothetical protein